MCSQSEQDLPLMANTDDILVDHYILHLNVDFENRMFHSKVYIFVTPVEQNMTDDERIAVDGRNAIGVIILDCKDIRVDKVEEIILDADSYVNDDPRGKFRPFVTGFAERVANMPHLATLGFSVDEWCVRIWKSARSSVWPRALCMHYSSLPHGTSVSWRRDQDGRDCCFTPGAQVNNRSLFPCQEPPIAMATWEAHVKVPPGAIAIMSSDQEPSLMQQDFGGTTYYLCTRMKLPMATLALAIGYWTVHELGDSCDPKEGVDVRCRIIAPPSILAKAATEMSTYLRKSLVAATRLLGPYPFRRLDVLILPRSFDSLGLASPNVTFLSQSIVASDGSMLVHVSHELSHAWFGLLIGARDWSEEWLSEGFATYMEDHIHARAMEWSQAEAKEWAKIRTFLRRRMLAAEVENTECELQTLRPNKCETEDVAVGCVKNGMNPNKSFTQVHYLKGFFLLTYLSDFVGNERFLVFLKEFVIRYHGQLIDSQQFFSFFFETFPEIEKRDLSATSLYDQWLDYPGFPRALGNDDQLCANQLYVEILTQVKWWQEHNTYHLIKSKRRRSKKHEWDFGELKTLRHSEQLVAILELLLHETKLSKQTLTSVCFHYKLDAQNANVRHRWCELIIKHNYGPGLNVVRNFLTEDQAMGVYLYGELLLSWRKTLKDLAVHCWHLLRNEMGTSAHQVVQEMLEGV